MTQWEKNAHAMVLTEVFSRPKHTLLRSIKKPMTASLCSVSRITVIIRLPHQQRCWKDQMKIKCNGTRANVPRSRSFVLLLLSRRCAPRHREVSWVSNLILALHCVAIGFILEYQRVKNPVIHHDICLQRRAKEGEKTPVDISAEREINGCWLAAWHLR